MAAAGGAAGPAPDVTVVLTCSTTVDIYYNYGIDNNNAASTMVKAARLSA
jgi:hypothetical protein